MNGRSVLQVSRGVCPRGVFGVAIRARLVDVEGGQSIDLGEIGLYPLACSGPFVAVPCVEDVRWTSPGCPRERVHRGAVDYNEILDALANEVVERACAASRSRSAAEIASTTSSRRCAAVHRASQ